MPGAWSPPCDSRGLRRASRPTLGPSRSWDYKVFLALSQSCPSKGHSPLLPEMSALQTGPSTHGLNANSLGTGPRAEPGEKERAPTKQPPPPTPWPPPGRTMSLSPLGLPRHQPEKTQPRKQPKPAGDWAGKGRVKGARKQAPLRAQCERWDSIQEADLCSARPEY